MGFKNFDIPSAACLSLLFHCFLIANQTGLFHIERVRQVLDVEALRNVRGDDVAARLRRKGADHPAKLQDLLVTQVCEEVREGVSEAGERLQAVRAREAGDV